MTGPIAVVTIGAPGSGKSHFLEDGLPGAYTRVCPDDIRYEMTGDAGDQTCNGEVWTEAYRRIGEALAEGRNVVVDAANCRQDDRRDLVRHCLKQGAVEVTGLWFRTPLAVCLDRAGDRSQRERKVPDGAICAMHKRLQMRPPSLNDGFTALIPVG